MALQKVITVDLVTGVSVDVDSYIRVDRIDASKVDGKATVAFHAGPDNAIYRMKEYNVPLLLSGSNFIAQAYEHLKTLSEFSGATDV